MRHSQKAGASSGRLSRRRNRLPVVSLGLLFSSKSQDSDFVHNDRSFSLLENQSGNRLPRVISVRFVFCTMQRTKSIRSGSLNSEKSSHCPKLAVPSWLRETSRTGFR